MALFVSCCCFPVLLPLLRISQWSSVWTSLIPFSVLYSHSLSLTFIHITFCFLSYILSLSLSHTYSVCLYISLLFLYFYIYLINVYLYPLQKFDELIPDSYRIVNNKDIVPRIPRSSKTNRFLQYEHVGRTVMINGGDFETTEPSIGTAPIAVWVQGENDGMRKMERQGRS